MVFVRKVLGFDTSIAGLLDPLQSLFARGVDVDIPNPDDGMTPLMNAIQHRRMKIAATARIGTMNSDTLAPSGISLPSIPIRKAQVAKMWV